MRLGSRHSGDATRILFCTVGVLLRRLAGGDVNDQTLSGVSHVVIDEVRPPTSWSYLVVATSR